MSNFISLSYVITTYNKLPYLKEVIKRLLENIQSDEEIIITDGGSSDGTVDYLSELYKQGKIQHFISEPDCGEAHGFNKGILLAKGELIKILTDDDAFYYPGIQECKRFMLENKEIEMLGASGASNSIANPNQFFELKTIYDEMYEKWIKNSVPFGFSGLGFMIRAKSISKTGLFHTGMVWIDYEFGMRVTSLNLNLAWYSNNLYVRISNDSSNSSKYSQRLQRDSKRCDYFYQGIIQAEEQIPSQKIGLIDSLYLKFTKSRINTVFQKTFTRVIKSNTKNTHENYNNQSINSKDVVPVEYDISDAFEISNNWLENSSKEIPTVFYTKEQFKTIS